MLLSTVFQSFLIFKNLFSLKATVCVAGLPCDEGADVQKCVDEFNFCLSRETQWPDDPSVLCPLCVPTFGLCLNATQCYGSAWRRYTAVCRETARCPACISSPSAAAANNGTQQKGSPVLRMLLSLALATVLLVLAGGFALKVSW